MNCLRKSPKPNWGIVCASLDAVELQERFDGSPMYQDTCADLRSDDLSFTQKFSHEVIADPNSWATLATLITAEWFEIVAIMISCPPLRWALRLGSGAAERVIRLRCAVAARKLGDMEAIAGVAAQREIFRHRVLNDSGD